MQHRFLWRRWATCQFRPAADAYGDRRVVRVSAWPHLPGHDRDASP